MDQPLPLEREKRLLARLGPKLNGLNARFGASTTRGAVLTPNDVAAGVSFVRRPARDGTFIPDTSKQRLVMYIWAGHNSTSDLDKVLTGLVGEASRHVTWKPKPGEIRKLAGLALLEHIWPTPCRSCSATGQVYEKVYYAKSQGLNQPSYAASRLELSTCKACGGTGRRAWGRHRLASLLEVTEWEWRRVWAKRYYRMQTMVRWMELRALAQIRRALRRH